MRAFREPLPLTAAISMAVLGDSLAYGLGASRPENGLAHLLFGRVREIRPGSTYANFGVPHSTVGDVLRHQVPQLHRSARRSCSLLPARTTCATPATRSSSRGASGNCSKASTTLRRGRRSLQPECPTCPVPSPFRRS